MKEPHWLHSGYPHIWLPYAQMQSSPLPLPVASAQGCSITLTDGRELLDGIAAWWSMAHGYQHPQIVEAISTQAQSLSHVMFAGLAHEPAYALAQTLTQMAPRGLNRVFFADSGSIAVEVALKMALQYWRNIGQPHKRHIISFTNGYHGDTFGAMSVSSRGGFHAAYDSLISEHHQLDIPQDDEAALSSLDAALGEKAAKVAAIIIEPLVQGAGGMKFHSSAVLKAIADACKRHNILFIADEIMTGFYRTGHRFACDEAGISPDIMCAGKALTGGHINLGATLATERLFEAFLGDTLDKALMHGPTFMANPLACAAANASLALFDATDYASKVHHIEQQLLQELEPLRGVAGVLDVRVKGAIGVVQIEATQQDMFALRPQFIERGVWLRPFSDCIYIMPPLVIRPDELTRLTQAVIEVTRQWSEQQQRKQAA